MKNANSHGDRLVIIGHEPPYPPRHGGKADTWNRIVGLSSLGVKVFLLYWYDSDRPTPEDRKKILEVVDGVVELSRTMTVFDLLHPAYPPRMMSCRIRGRTYRKILKKVKDFKPDCIWLDLWYGYLTARMLARDLNLPLVYRSQNNEALYFKQLYHDAKGFIKLKLFLNAIRMKRAERLIRNASDMIYEISVDDAENVKRENQSYPVKVLLPTYIGNRALNNDYGEELCCDILFAGNLHNPSNISGLKWFVEHVLCLMRERQKEIRVLFTGSSPVDSLVALCKKYSINVIPDPIDIEYYYERTKVIINPQLEGSGVSIKMIELLHTIKPIITTTVGTRGLPAEVAQLFAIADTPKEFAEKTISCLLENNVDSNKRKTLIKKHFGLCELEKVLEDIHGIKKAGTTPEGYHG